MTTDHHKSPQTDAPAAEKATTTRRTLLAVAAALPAVAAGPLALAAPPIPDAWQRLVDDLGSLHPNGRAAARRAAEAGFEYADIHSIALAGKGPKEGYPVIVVDAHNGGYHCVTPTYVTMCTWVRR